MTVLGLAAGIFLGAGALRVLEHALHLHHDSVQRRAMKTDLEEAATGFIDKMHAEMEAEKAKEAEAEAVKKQKATRRKRAATKSVTKTPAVKAATKGVKNVRRTNR